MTEDEIAVLYVYIAIIILMISILSLMIISPSSYHRPKETCLDRESSEEKHLRKKRKCETSFQSNKVKKSCLPKAKIVIR